MKTMKVLEAGFAKDLIALTQRGYMQGWHERNGGNVSYRLKPEEVDSIKSNFKTGLWNPIGVDVVGLAGEFVMITAAGSFFSEIAKHPKELLGIIEIDMQGKNYRVCWGFKGDHRPTSELASHLLNQELKKSVTDGKSRVVYHCHPTNLIALTFVLPLDAMSFTRALWGMISECAMVFPEGVGVLDWMVPGSIDLGYESAHLMAECNAVIWAYHGLICTGETFEDAFGLAETIEKAAEILVKVKSMQTGDFQMIGDGCLRQMAEAYDIDLPDKYFAQPKASMEEMLYANFNTDPQTYMPEGFGTDPGIRQF